MNMIFLYYDNPRMLKIQIRYWNSYAGILTQIPEILLVDDSSPRTNAAKIVKKVGCEIPIRIFRINENIQWNMPGARNLGCHHAKGWIYMSDIDTVIPKVEAKKLFEKYPLDENCFYMPKRVWLPGSTPAAPAIVNLLYHKSQYQKIGGYDEDYSGSYYKEDVDYIERLKRSIPMVERNDVTIKVVHHSVVSDSRTRGMSRDRSRNQQLFQEKEALGFPKPINPLRFSWEREL